MTNHFFERLVGAGRDAAPFARMPGQAALSYGDMRRRSAAMAAALANLGVAPGDRIAVLIEKSIDGLMLYLGTLRAGAVFLPLNTAYTVAELDYFFADAEPKLVVCDPSRAADIAPLAARHNVGSVETLDAQGAGSMHDKADAAGGDSQDAPAPRAPDDLAAILYTSGTTGRSKGAMLTHGNLVSNAEALVDIWRFSDADVLIHALPIYHTHGLFVACNTVLASGASMILMPRFEADALIAAMPAASVLMGVPTFYTRLLDHPGLSREATGHMRLFVSGSAPLPAETHRAWSARTGHAILERYGMTETNMNTSNPYVGERRPGAVGVPLPGVALRLVDPETGAASKPEAVGMIEIAGPNVCKGYWRNSEKTAEAFRPDGFFVTGDLGRIDADGYLQIVGRDKDLVISGGFNIYPVEVETEIDALEGVLESAIVGVPHRDLGEGVLAVVVPRGRLAVDEAVIKAALADRLARYKQPKRVVFVDELPRNPMGKVQKNVLRETFREIFSRSA